MIELINAVVACLTHVNSQEALETVCSNSKALVGAKYTAVKQEVQHMEQVLLREIGFQLVVDNSHRYILNFSKSLQLNHSIVQLAVFLGNDSLLYSPACLLFSAAEIAAGCLLVASRLLARRYTLPRSDVLNHFAAFGLCLENVDNVGHVLVDMTNRRMEKSRDLQQTDPL